MLGVDVGTSGVKVLAVNEKGNVLASSFETYPLIQSKPGWSEQNPEDWWNAVVLAINNIVSNPDIDPSMIRSLSLSGQMHGSVFLDDQQQVVRFPLLWNDTRTFKECRKITEIVGEENLLTLVGNPALEGFTAPKLIWLRKNEPQNYAKVKTLFLPKDYINFRLTGRLCTEKSDAAGTLFLDVKNGSWSDILCDKLEIDKNILPEILNSVDVVGQLKPDVAVATGLNKSVLVIAGGADNACGAIGNGIINEGTVLVSIGSSGVVMAHTDKMHHDPKGRIHSFNHSKPGSWYLMGVMLSAGLSMSWLKNDLLKLDYDTINKQAAEVKPGADGVMFLPYLSGERTPHRDPMARGVFFGLSGIHSQKHLMRSVFEGVAFGLRDSMELINALGVDTKQIRITGGGAKSSLWRQIIANVFNREVITMQSDEGPAFGAALLAGVGSGIFNAVDEAVAATVFTADSTMPESENVEKYEKIYPLYTDIYKSLRNTYSKAYMLYESL